MSYSYVTHTKFSQIPFIKNIRNKTKIFMI